jgi:hypothetical protein
MKFLIEVGKLKSAKGWLPRMEAAEVLETVRELRLQGTRDIHIYDTESFVCVTETALARHVRAARRRH